MIKTRTTLIALDKRSLIIYFKATFVPHTEENNEVQPFADFFSSPKVTWTDFYADSTRP